MTQDDAKRMSVTAEARQDGRLHWSGPPKALRLVDAHRASCIVCFSAVPCCCVIQNWEATVGMHKCAKYALLWPLGGFFSLFLLILFFTFLFALFSIPLWLFYGKALQLFQTPMSTMHCGVFVLLSREPFTDFAFLFALYSFSEWPQYEIVA